MTLETFIKLASGTREDFIIACSWLVTYHDPVEYVMQHGNTSLDSNGLNSCFKSIAWDGEWNGNYSEENLYYKYKNDRYILRCRHGMTVTNRNYDGSAEVINH